jgi:hemerythrin-like domain-containing protein
MAAVIKELQLDHANFLRLLGVLEKELAVFDAGDTPDYEIIGTVAQYFMEYSERFHHPLENAIYDRLAERDPDLAAKMGDLRREHEGISEGARQFLEATQAILKEAELPRSVFHDRVAAFIKTEREHIAMEEQSFLKAASKRLTSDDWQAVEKTREKAEDPVFGEEAQNDFRDLAAHLLEWERENRASRKAALSN